MKTQKHKYKFEFIKVGGQRVYLSDVICTECQERVKGFHTFYKHLPVIISYDKETKEKHFWGVSIPGNWIEYSYCADCYLNYLRN